MLLAIDTSTGTSVAVVDRDRGILAEIGTDDTMRHAEVVGDLIRDALDAAGVRPGELSGVAGGMGPGPFTGLRVGIAAAHAFALGIAKPFVPVVSHDAVAWAWYRAGGAGALQVVTDARRREFAVSDYDGLDDDHLPVRAGGPTLVSRDEVPGARGIRIDAAIVPAGAVGMLAELAFTAGRLPLAMTVRPADPTPKARDSGVESRIVSTCRSKPDRIRHALTRYPLGVASVCQRATLNLASSTTGSDPVLPTQPRTQAG